MTAHDSPGGPGRAAPATAGAPLTSALLIDDHPLFCDALGVTLRAVSGLCRIETADRLDAALDWLAANPAPDMIFLDLNLPDVTGLDGLMRLRAVAPRTPIVIVSSLADNRMIGAALRAGACGFVPKHSQRGVFREALQTLAAGGIFTPAGYVDDPAPDEGRAYERLSSLTQQQGRILQLICAGRLNKQIAYDLGIAETTVKAHVTAIMRKLGVHSRTQAVLIAQEASFAALLQSDR